MTRSQIWLLSIFVQSFFLPMSTAAETTQLKCRDSLVTFEYARQEELKCLCTATEAALTFLASVGLEISGEITIKVAKQLPTGDNHVILGSYNSRTQEVYLLSYPEALERSQQDRLLFGIPFSEELWCSYAAHELAHVISSRYLSQRIVPHTAGEYIAAVTQLMTLTNDTRTAILKNYRHVAPYASTSEMSEIYFLFAPQEFAIKSYLHFISLENPRDFIERLVNEGTTH